MKNNEVYDHCLPSVYYDVIIERNGQSAEAAYYLLKKRLLFVLKHLYEEYGFCLMEEFEDTIDDFFLYLHDGSDPDKEEPFSMLEGVNNKKAFFSWVLSTYRIFLLNKSKEENRKGIWLEHLRVVMGEDEKHLSEETMTHFLATAIAYADQVFVPRNRFIFYRMILSFLDHSMAIPQEDMARALEMHPVTYRVCTKRQKDRFLGFILLQETGKLLELDRDHCAMRDTIVSRSEHLYEVLIEYYDQALMQLPTALQINNLRYLFSNGSAMMMHDYEAYYTSAPRTPIRVVYPQLKLFLETPSAVQS